MQCLLCAIPLIRTSKDALKRQNVQCTAILIFIYRQGLNKEIGMCNRDIHRRHAQSEPGMCFFTLPEREREQVERKCKEAKTVLTWCSL